MLNSSSKMFCLTFGFTLTECGNKLILKPLDYKKFFAEKLSR